MIFFVKSKLIFINITFMPDALSLGIWAGVELDNQEGKNDGTVKGMR